MSTRDDVNYVRVSKLDLGDEGLYTDYEELAFTDTDAEPYQWLKDAISSHGYYPVRDTFTGELKERETQIARDRADAVHYCVAHVISSWTDLDGASNITPEAVGMLVDCAWEMLNILTAGWIMRAGFDWDEEQKAYKEKYGKKDRGH